MRTEPYIRLPFRDRGRDFDGVDCWGLIRLVYQREYGIDLPLLADSYSTIADVDQVARTVQLEAKERWAWVVPGQERAGDVIVLRVARRPIHCGVVIGRPRMLHILDGCDSVIERYDLSCWNRRVDGFYRYRT